MALPSKKRKTVLERDNYQCQNCHEYGGEDGPKNLEVHYIVPSHTIGTDNLSNLITLCKECQTSTPWPNGEDVEFNKAEIHQNCIPEDVVDDRLLDAVKIVYPIAYSTGFKEGVEKTQAFTEGFEDSMNHFRDN